MGTKYSVNYQYNKHLTIQEKISEIWESLNTESQNLFRNIEMYREYGEQINVFQDWMEDEGKEMRSHHMRVDLKGLVKSREDDFFESLEYLLIHMNRKKEQFLANLDESYFDWLFEMPYLLEEKFFAYNLLQEEEKQ